MDMEKTFRLDDILALERLTRTNLINSIGGFKSVGLIGTQNKLGQTNLSIFSSIVHIGAHPPLIGLIFRPGNPMRDTLANILETGYYTINHIHEGILSQAHQTSAHYPADQSEFDAVGLTPYYDAAIPAPFVAESKIQLGVQFKEQVDITSNNTHLIIGEIVYLKVPENCLGSDGFVHLDKANTLTCSGLDAYHSTNTVNRYSYAKPDKDLTSLLSNE
jgi:flavin reductase (DIM6/NTAB) family NADH-FMN oxidoreductase RutF